MKNIRIIPRLDVKGPNLVKGIYLEGLRVLGKPEDFARYYYQSGADELIYIDVVASLYNRNSLHDIIRRTASEIFIPITVGGGLRTLDDIRGVLRAGADKIAVNTAAIRNPKFIKEASRTFGSQCIVVSIQAKLRENGKYEAFTDNGRERTEKDVFNWAKEAVDLGAGELLITSIDREGTGRGYDVELVRRITKIVPVPVIACGGAGRLEHFLEVIQEGCADALCAASIFHYFHLRMSHPSERFKDEGNIEFLKENRGSLEYLKAKIQPADIAMLKNFLQNSDIPCRLMSRYINA